MSCTQDVRGVVSMVLQRRSRERGLVMMMCVD